MEGDVTVEAWSVHDSGLNAAPGPFRRLGGAVRHHRGRGERWPTRVTLTVAGGELVVAGIGTWPRAQVAVRVTNPGPPRTFVLTAGEASHLLSAPAGPATDALLAALSD